MSFSLDVSGFATTLAFFGGARTTFETLTTLAFDALPTAGMTCCLRLVPNAPVNDAADFCIAATAPHR